MKLLSKLIVLLAFLQVITVSEACKSYSEDCKEEAAAAEELAKDTEASKEDKCDATLTLGDCKDANRKEGEKPYCETAAVKLFLASGDAQKDCPALCTACHASPSAVLTACLALAATASLMAA